MKKLFLRSMASLLSITLLSTQVLFAHQAEINFWSERRKTISPPTAASPTLLATLNANRVGKIPMCLHGQNIPASLHPLVAELSHYATVNSLKQSDETAPVVVCVQDVHGNKEAQRNIGQLLLALLNAHPDMPINVEGAAGAIDWTPFRQSSININKETGSFFLNAALLTGAEYAGIAANQTPNFNGMENEALYMENVRAVRSALTQQAEQLQHLQKQRVELDRQKHTLFSPAILMLETQREQYELGQLPITDYAIALQEARSGAQIDEHSMLSSFFKALRLEKNLSFERAERERTHFFSQLIPRLSIDETNTLVADSAALKSGGMTTVDYYHELKALALSHQLSMRTTPEFERYLAYTELVEKIEGSTLLKEFKQYEHAVWRNVSQTPAQQQWVRAAQQVSRLQTLVRLSLTEDDYRDISVREVPNSLAPFAEFYRAADARSAAMLKNMNMRAPLSVVLAGGFHTNALVQGLLAEKKTIIVVSPKLTSVDNRPGNSYLSIFTQQKTPLDQLFKSPQLTLVETLAVKPIENANRSAALIRALTEPINKLLYRLSETTRAELAIETPGIEGRVVAEVRDTTSPIASTHDNQAVLEAQTDNGVDIAVYPADHSWAREGARMLTAHEIKKAVWQEWWFSIPIVLPMTMAALISSYFHLNSGIAASVSAAVGLIGWLLADQYFQLYYKHHVVSGIHSENGWKITHSDLVNAAVLAITVFSILILTSNSIALYSTTTYTRGLPLVAGFTAWSAYQFFHSSINAEAIKNPNQPPMAGVPTDTSKQKIVSLFWSLLADTFGTLSITTSEKVLEEHPLHVEHLEPIVLVGTTMLNWNIDLREYRIDTNELVSLLSAVKRYLQTTPYRQATASNVLESGEPNVQLLRELLDDRNPEHAASLVALAHFLWDKKDLQSNLDVNPEQLQEILQTNSRIEITRRRQLTTENIRNAIGKGGPMLATDAAALRYIRFILIDRRTKWTGFGHNLANSQTVLSKLNSALTDHNLRAELVEWMDDMPGFASMLTAILNTSTALMIVDGNFVFTPSFMDVVKSAIKAQLPNIKLTKIRKRQTALIPKDIRTLVDWGMGSLILNFAVLHFPHYESDRRYKALFDFVNREDAKRGRIDRRLGASANGTPRDLKQITIEHLKYQLPASVPLLVLGVVFPHLPLSDIYYQVPLIALTTTLLVAAIGWNAWNRMRAAHVPLTTDPRFADLFRTDNDRTYYLDVYLASRALLFTLLLLQTQLLSYGFLFQLVGHQSMELSVVISLGAFAFAQLPSWGAHVFNNFSDGLLWNQTLGASGWMNGKPLIKFADFNSALDSIDVTNPDDVAMLHFLKSVLLEYFAAELERIASGILPGDEDDEKTTRLRAMQKEFIDNYATARAAILKMGLKKILDQQLHQSMGLTINLLGNFLEIKNNRLVLSTSGRARLATKAREQISRNEISLDEAATPPYLYGSLYATPIVDIEDLLMRVRQTSPFGGDPYLTKLGDTDISVLGMLDVLDPMVELLVRRIQLGDHQQAIVLLIDNIKHWETGAIYDTALLTVYAHLLAAIRDKGIRANGLDQVVYPETRSHLTEQTREFYPTILRTDLEPSNMYEKITELVVYEPNFFKAFVLRYLLFKLEVPPQKTAKIMRRAFDILDFDKGERELLSLPHFGDRDGLAADPTSSHFSFVPLFLPAMIASTGIAAVMILFAILNAEKKNLTDVTQSADNLMRNSSDPKTVALIDSLAGPLDRKLLARTFDFATSRSIIEQRLMAQQERTTHAIRHHADKRETQIMVRNTAYLVGRAGRSKDLAYRLVNQSGEKFSALQRFLIGADYHRGRFIQICLGLWNQPRRAEYTNQTEITRSAVQYAFDATSLLTNNDAVTLAHMNHRIEKWDTKKHDILILRVTDPNIDIASVKAQLIAQLHQENTPRIHSYFEHVKWAIVNESDGLLSPSMILEAAGFHVAQFDRKLEIYTTHPERFELNDPAVRFVLYSMLTDLYVVPLSTLLMGARVIDIAA